jgi:putative PIN family toxin of toxin-antitoxin system
MGKKIKVVLDANVWVSIFMKKTLAEEFSKLFETRKINVYNSEAILNEISKVLMYPKINDIVRLS